MLNQSSGQEIETSHYASFMETYVESVCSYIAPHASERDLAEIRREIESHLAMSASAHEELGASQEEAIACATQGFGNPAEIGRRLAREQRAKNRPAHRKALLERAVMSAVIGLAATSASSVLPRVLGVANWQGYTGAFLLTGIAALQACAFGLGASAAWLSSRPGTGWARPIAALVGSQAGMAAATIAASLVFGRSLFAPTAVPFDTFAGAAAGALIFWMRWRRQSGLGRWLLCGAALFNVPLLILCARNLLAYALPEGRFIVGLAGRAIVDHAVAGALVGWMSSWVPVLRDRVTLRLHETQMSDGESPA